MDAVWQASECIKKQKERENKISKYNNSNISKARVTKAAAATCFVCGNNGAINIINMCVRLCA